MTLTLAGDGEESETLKAQVQRLGLGDAVRFIGHVKARYGFSKGSLLVVPSRGDSMPYVVIEAAAAGIPMVAANVGGIPEIFGSHGDALFAPSNAAAMADAIETALKDPAAATGAGKIAARTNLHAFFAEGDGRGRLGRLPRRVCQSLTVLYRRNRFFRFVP